MQLISFRILMNDVPAGIRFWRDVMQLKLTYGDEAMGYAYFDTGSTGIELMGRESFASALGQNAQAGNAAIITFRVEEVDKIYADLVARGAKAVAGPMDRPMWGARTAHVSDPEGNLVEVYSKL